MNFFFPSLTITNSQAKVTIDKTNEIPVRTKVKIPDLWKFAKPPLPSHLAGAISDATVKRAAIAVMIWNHCSEVCPLDQIGTTLVVSAPGVVPRIRPSVRPSVGYVRRKGVEEYISRLYRTLELEDPNIKIYS